MAKRPELQHSPTQALQRNRRRLQEAQQNIDRASDRPSAGGLKERTGPGEGAARSLRGKVTDFEIVEGRSDDALGIKRHRVKKELKAQQNVEQRKPGRSDTRKSDLSIPIVRAKRIATDDGRTSFHFSHDSISKTNREIVSDTGRANRPGAAKSHNKYIERDSAVAINDNGLAATADSIAVVGIAGDRLDGLAHDGRITNDNDNGKGQNDDGRIEQASPGNGAEGGGAAIAAATRRLRAARAVVDALFPDPDDDPRRNPADGTDGLRHMPVRQLVPYSPEAQMLLFGNADPVVGRGRNADQGVRHARDGDRQDQPERRGLTPVPAFITPGAADRPRRGMLPVPAFLGRRKPVEREARPVPAGREPANDTRTPDGQGVYIERQEALAIQPDGTRVLFTNIDEDPAERAEFWRLVEKHERDAEPDKISFQINQNPEFWARVAADPKCPPLLAEGIATADPGRPVRIAAGDNIEIRKFLSKIEGWDSVGERRNDEDAEAYRRRRAGALCKFHDGRGGRVQYRIIGELPYELDIAGRASVLKKFSEEFAKRQLPFVAVMHAPDHTNSDKNWHFHLVYHDRPTGPLTQSRIDEYVASKGRPTDDLKPARWDFTVIDHEHDKKNWNNRAIFPFAQPKKKEVAQDNKWIELLRKKLADITNDHLEEAGVARRLDPRTHEEMGIHTDPQEHLGTKLANLEAMGIATPTGVSNEERQWAAVLTKLNSDLDKRKDAVDRQAMKWLKQVEQSGLDDDTQRSVRGSVTRWHQHRTEAEEQEAIAINVDEHVERLTSRATKVLATCRKHIDAIDEGRATRFQQSRRKHLEAKADEAKTWLEETSKIIEKELDLSRDARRAAQQERLLADVLENGIERALLAGGRSTERRAPARDAANDQDTRRIAPAARAVASEEVEAWMRDIEQRRRRLKRVDRDTVPATMTEADRAIVESESYGEVRNRLKALKDRQDKIIADVAAFITQSPESVVLRRRGDVETYALIGTRPALAEAFRDYQQDPQLVRAREQALAAAAEARRARAEAVADERRENTASAERDDVATRRQTATDDQRRRDDAARQRAIGEAIVREIRNGALRIIVARGVATLSPADAARAKASADQLSDPALQRRLLGLAKVQEGEIRRLGGYVRSNPRSLVDREEGFALRANVPAEIAEIARRWQNDKALGEELRTIRDAATPKARQQGLPLEEPTRAPAPSSPTTRRDAERPTMPRPERPAATPAVTPAASTPGRPGDVPGRPDADRRDAPRPEAPRAPAPAVVGNDGVRPSTERITTLAPDAELRQQAQRRAAEQRIAKEAAEARRAATRGRGRTDAADAPERVTRTAAQAAAMASAHPLIREWDRANAEGRTDDRQRIAADIVADRAARADLQRIERNIARRIKEEGDRVIAARQPGLGLGLDDGPALRREDD